MKILCFVLDLTPTGHSDPCQPSPCGPNTICKDGICSCLRYFHGDPNLGCRPECVYNTDCSLEKGCRQNKCVDPCIGTCGVNAICEVMNHIPMCSCPRGLSGNAFVECRPSRGTYLLILFPIYKTRHL